MGRGHGEGKRRVIYCRLSALRSSGNDSLENGRFGIFPSRLVLARLVRELQREGKDPHKVDKCGAISIATGNIDCLVLQKGVQVLRDLSVFAYP